MEVILKDLPKISLNDWYAGKHWTNRKKIKDQYILIIKSQFKHVFSKESLYHVHYEFGFKTKPLDASNCMAMLKMIEDVIFEDDSYKIIPFVAIYSLKASTDYVRINVIKI